jgi:hypothetical protein
MVDTLLQIEAAILRTTMPKLRRKRVWLLALLVLAIVVGASIWSAATEKSEFGRQYERIPLGVSFEEVSNLMEPGSLFSIHKEFLPSARTRCDWTDDGEHFILTFENNKLTEKEFKPLAGIDKLRRMWGRRFKSNPPF